VQVDDPCEFFLPSVASLCQAFYGEYGIACLRLFQPLGNQFQNFRVIEPGVIKTWGVNKNDAAITISRMWNAYRYNLLRTRLQTVADDCFLRGAGLIDELAQISADPMELEGNHTVLFPTPVGPMTLGDQVSRCLRSLRKQAHGMMVSNWSVSVCIWTENNFTEVSCVLEAESDDFKFVGRTDRIKGRFHRA
jgi:hypothetical protein